MQYFMPSGTTGKVFIVRGLKTRLSECPQEQDGYPALVGGYWHSAKSAAIELGAGRVKSENRCMAVRFVIGRAGTGKTQYGLEQLVQEAVANPLGPPLYWLTPEQASFMSQRRLLADPRLTGTFRVRVTGFRRLCRLLATDLGLPIHNELTPVSRLLLLAQAVRQCRCELTIFRAPAARPDFVGALDSILAELVSSGHTPESLRALANRLSQNSTDDPALENKLRDLAAILQKFTDRAASQGLDPNVLPRLLTARLKTQRILEESLFFVDGFSSLSMLEIELLAQIARQSPAVIITLLADPAAAAMMNPTLAPDEMSIFYRTETLYQRLLKAFRQAGAAVAPPVYLAEFHRFQRPVLAELERRLFDADGAGSGEARSAAQSHLSTRHSPPAMETEAVEIWSCESPEAEVLAAARYIQRLTFRGLRYRDIGLVLTDPGAYEEPLRRIFDARKIPFFLDRRRSLAHHPLVELLRSAVTLVAGRYARQDVLAFVKTSLAGITAEDGWALENYMLGHGVDGDDLSRSWSWRVWPSDPEAEEANPRQVEEMTAANRARMALHAALGAWIRPGEQAASAAGPSRTAGEFAAGLLDLLTRLRVRATLQAWMNAARVEGRSELAQIHEQAYRQCLELLTAIRHFLPHETMTAAEFGDLLRHTLSAITLGLIPPVLDQVLISSADRSRHPELQVVILLGAVETRLPHLAPEDPMFDDEQRRRINLHTPGGVHPDSAAALLENRFFDYVALTRASRALVVSWPATDGQGRRHTPSPYLERLKQLPGVASKNLFATRFDLRYAADVRDVVEAVLVAEAGEGPAGGVSPPWGGRQGIAGAGHDAVPPVSAGATEREINRRQIATARQWLQAQSHPLVRPWRQYVGPAGPQPAGPDRRTAADPVLAAGTIAAMTTGPLSLSVSQLQTFAACPLQHFFSYQLALRERCELALDPRGLGQLYHRILERFYAGVIRDLQQDQVTAAPRTKSSNLKSDSSKVKLEIPDIQTPSKNPQSSPRAGATAAPLWPHWPSAADGSPPPELSARLSAMIDGEAQALPSELFASQPETQAMLRPLRRQLEVVLEAQRRAAAGNALRPVGVEIPFGEPRHRPPQAGRMALPAWRVELGGGRQAELNGKIDRLDADPAGYAVVIDYKRAATPRFNAVQMQAGLDLQLVSYLLAVRRGPAPAMGPLVPCGAFYQTVTPQDNDAPDASPADDAFYKACKPAGLFDDEQLNRLDPALGSGGTSAWFHARLKKDGTPHPSGHDGVPPEAFRQLLELAETVIASLARQIVSGVIAPNPYRLNSVTACRFCAFKSLCPFDRLYGPWRKKIPALSGRRALNFVLETA